MRHKIMLAISTRLFPAKGKHRKPVLPQATAWGRAPLSHEPRFSVATVALTEVLETWPVFSSSVEAASHRRAWVTA